MLSFKHGQNARVVPEDGVFDANDGILDVEQVDH